MLLREPRVFALALDVERLALRIQILRPDLDLGALLDLVAHAPARFDRLGQLGQALGVERIGAVEEFEAGLVEVDDGDAFEFEAVLGEPFARRRPSRARRSPAAARAAPRVSFARRRSEAPRRTGPRSVPARPSGLQRAPAKRLGGAAHLLAGRADANEEVGDDIDAHSVLGDETLRLAARHLNPHHVHADRRDVVQDRNDECAAADDDLLAAETRFERTRSPSIERRYSQRSR